MPSGLRLDPAVLGVQQFLALPFNRSLGKLIARDGDVVALARGTTSGRGQPPATTMARKGARRTYA